MCVDHITRYLVLAPLKDKTVTRVAHALVTHLFCPFSTPRVILSDNGADFRNAVVGEICSQFGVTQTFTAACHPASNGLVERANRKILEVLRPIVNDLLDNWEDWLPHVAASINSSVNGEAVAEILACGPLEPVVPGSIPGRDTLGFFSYRRVV